MSIITEYPNANIRNFFNRHQLPKAPAPNWGNQFYKQGVYGEYDNRHHISARNMETNPDEEHIGNFESITLNYDPNVNPEIYRYINDRFKPDGSLPDIQNDFISGNFSEEFGFYLNTIVPLTRTYKKYFKVLDNGVKHIYVRPLNQPNFEGDIHVRDHAYLGVYDEHLMGPEYKVSQHIGDYLNWSGTRNIPSLKILASRQLDKTSQQQKMHASREVDKTSQEHLDPYHTPTGGNKLRKSKRKKSKNNKSRKNKSRRYKV